MVICKDYGEVTYEYQLAAEKLSKINGVKCHMHIPQIGGPFGMIRFCDPGDAEHLLKGLENVKVFFTPEGLETATISLLMRVNMASRGSN